MSSSKFPFDAQSSSSFVFMNHGKSTIFLSVIISSIQHTSTVFLSRYSKNRRNSKEFLEMFCSENCASFRDFKEQIFRYNFVLATLLFLLEKPRFYDIALKSSPTNKILAEALSQWLSLQRHPSFKISSFFSYQIIEVVKYDSLIQISPAL